MVSPVSLRPGPGGPGTSALVRGHPEELSRVWRNEGGEGSGPANEALCSSQALTGLTHGLPSWLPGFCPGPLAVTSEAPFSGYLPHTPHLPGPTQTPFEHIPGLFGVTPPRGLVHCFQFPHPVSPSLVLDAPLGPSHPEAAPCVWDSLACFQVFPSCTLWLPPTGLPSGAGLGRQSPPWEGH